MYVVVNVIEFLIYVGEIVNKEIVWKHTDLEKWNWKRKNAIEKKLDSLNSKIKSLEEDNANFAQEIQNLEFIQNAIGAYANVFEVKLDSSTYKYMATPVLDRHKFYKYVIKTNKVKIKIHKYNCDIIEDRFIGIMETRSYKYCIEAIYTPVKIPVKIKEKDFIEQFIGQIRITNIYKKEN